MKDEIVDIRNAARNLAARIENLAYTHQTPELIRTHLKLMDAEVQILRACSDLFDAAELVSVSHEQAKALHVKDANKA